MTASRPSLLRRLLGRQTVPPADDFGDMGTAIGLEYSLDQRPAAAEPLGGDQGTGPETGGTPATGRRWLPRWHAR